MVSTVIAQVVAGPAPKGSSLETFIYILVGVFGLAGFSGLAGLWRLARKSGVRDANIDKTVEAVLDPEKGTVKKIDGLTETQVKHGEALQRIEYKLSVNGLDSQNVGDVAKRVEIAVKDIDKFLRETNAQLERHIGQHDERDAQLDRRLQLLEVS